MKHLKDLITFQTHLKELSVWLILLMMISCATKVPKKVNLDWYAGSPEAKGVINSEGYLIQCTDKHFIRYYCLSKRDVKTLKRRLNSCGE